MKRYDKPLSAEELAALPDSEIDYSDIPETDEAFWRDAQFVMPEQKKKISIRLNPHTLDFFQREGAATKPASAPCSMLTLPRMSSASSF